jgi:hypothetical protein
VRDGWKGEAEKGSFIVSFVRRVATPRDAARRRAVTAAADGRAMGATHA